MDILVTVNRYYLHPLAVMLKSLLLQTEQKVDVYVMNRTLTAEDFQKVRSWVSDSRLSLYDVHVEKPILEEAPTSKRYQMEIYDRLFACRYLPREMDRILYLDPDLVAIKPVEDLFTMDLGQNLYAAASHVRQVGTAFNELRVGAKANSVYVNSGVLMMNLSLLRDEMDPEEITRYIKRHYLNLNLPDQDIITALYGNRILELDAFEYNMTERMLRFETVVEGRDEAWHHMEEVTRIIHYIGRNKPWRKNYSGRLDIFYLEAARQLAEPEKS